MTSVIATNVDYASASPAWLTQPRTDGKALKGSSMEEKARKVAQDFEATLLNTLTKAMFAGLKSDGPTGGGKSEDMYRSLQAEEFANALSRAGGIGLSDIIYKEIMKMQEANES